MNKVPLVWKLSWTNQKESAKGKCYSFDTSRKSFKIFRQDSIEDISLVLETLYDFHILVVEKSNILPLCIYFSTELVYKW